jgi:hypothetical protein
MSPAHLAKVRLPDVGKLVRSPSRRDCETVMMPALERKRAPAVIRIDIHRRRTRKRRWMP